MVMQRQLTEREAWELVADTIYVFGEKVFERKGLCFVLTTLWERGLIGRRTYNHMQTKVNGYTGLSGIVKMEHMQDGVYLFPRNSWEMRYTWAAMLAEGFRGGLLRETYIPKRVRHGRRV